MTALNPVQLWQRKTTIFKQVLNPVVAHLNAEISSKSEASGRANE